MVIKWDPPNDNNDGIPLVITGPVRSPEDSPGALCYFCNPRQHPRGAFRNVNCCILQLYLCKISNPQSRLRTTPVLKKHQEIQVVHHSRILEKKSEIQVWKFRYLNFWKSQILCGAFLKRKKSEIQVKNSGI